MAKLDSRLDKSVGETTSLLDTNANGNGNGNAHGIPRSYSSPRFTSFNDSPSFASRSSSRDRGDMSSDTMFFKPFKRSNSLSLADLTRINPQRPLFRQLLSALYSVTNPTSADPSNFISFNLQQGMNENPNHNDLDYEDHAKRLNMMNTIRSYKLIGNYRSLANWDDGYVDLSKVKNKKLKRYYKNQNYLIRRFKEIDSFLDAGKIHLSMLNNYGEHSRREQLSLISEEEYPSDTVNSKHTKLNDVPGNLGTNGAQFLGYDEELDNRGVLVAILVNFFINILLLVGKIVVAILTSSMSMIASLVDSVLDFLSTFIIFIANQLSTTKNSYVEHAYPIGRSRLEPLGVLIFSVIIILSFFQVGQESFKRLFFSSDDDKVTTKIGTQSILIMISTIVAKVGCWVWCAQSKSSAVQALAQDAKTDVIFNTVSLLVPTVGHFFDIWWLDSLGALALSVYIIVSWSCTAFEHIDNLTGAVAGPLDYQVILYLAYRFAESIKLITSLKAYHAGDFLMVEIDVVFDNEAFNLSLKDCHDIAEALQYAIESLPMVERAFVHIDYMEGNFKGHLK